LTPFFRIENTPSFVWPYLLAGFLVVLGKITHWACKSKEP
jgi:hypothetical protein